MSLLPKGLSRQITGLTMSIVMGVSIIVGVMALLVFYENSKDYNMATNRETARYIAAEIDMLMSRAQNVTDAIASDPLIANPDAKFVRAKIEPFYRASEIFSVIAIVDKKGNVVCTVPEKTDVAGQNISDQSFISEVFRTGQSIITGPVKGVSGLNLLVVASPIKDSGGQVTGAVSASMNLNKSTALSQIIGGKARDSAMNIEIIGKQNIIIYHPDKNKLLTKHDKGFEQELKTGRPGTKEIRIDGQPVLVGFAPITKLGWGVIVEYPTEKALSSAVYLRDMMIVVTILICLLVFCVTFLETKAITKPLSLLVEGVRKVAEGDYEYTVYVKSQNEIGVLAEAFNLMVSRIRNMRDDILQKKEELEKANIELEVMAITDGLTKLYNHRYFQDCLAKALTFAEQEKKSLALMLLDIDYFKLYNDLFGHQAGDKLLEELAQLLIRELGPNDMVARYGGEEFTVILYDADNTRGMEMAEKIRQAVESYPFPGREQQPEGKVTISIGVASYPENAHSKEELIRLADEALYKAKSCSRNKVELYFSVLDDLKQELDQSEVELVNSIKMLIRIINAKDKYTYGHCERVGKYAVMIAEKLELPEDDVKTIKMGAYLHDVGKIEISRSILMKKGPLTAEEFSIINKHPIWGAGIIKAVESLHPTLPLIKYHHERFNGKGYPQGLKGKQIPLHARILAVADSFDAMTSNRPYRKRKTEAEAVEELQTCSGTQFDPEIVAAFLCALQDNRAKVG